MSIVFSEWEIDATFTFVNRFLSPAVQPTMKTPHLLTLAFLFLTACSRFEPAKSRELDQSPAALTEAESSAGLPGHTAPARPEAMQSPDFRPAEGFVAVQADGRLLEYQIYLSYRANDLLAARKLLFTLVPRYGYPVRSTTVADGKLEVLWKVEAAKLWTALAELDPLGELISETIQVNDHTENMKAQEIKKKRNLLRSKRRAAALHTGLPDQTGREEQLAGSEDALDAAELETWRIEDRVRWATVQITVDAPQKAALDVPPYGDALQNGLELMLRLAYYLLYLWPVLVILFLLRLGYIFWRKRKRQS
ncbi:MAG: DUF4349 domain-containing protein [Spirochaetales bacterium]|nr:DUF4349 domain-containing protein [Spirochaetales bacterium]